MSHQHDPDYYEPRDLDDHDLAMCLRCGTKDERSLAHEVTRLRAEVERLRELNECIEVNERGAQEVIAELLERIGATHLDEACEELTRLHAVVAAADRLRADAVHVSGIMNDGERWVAFFAAIDGYDAARGAR